MDMDQEEIEAHIKGLRRDYIESHPAQRMHVIRQRLANPEHQPNLLVTYVSAVEALARSIAMHLQTGESLQAIYPRYKYMSPETIVEEIVEKKTGQCPEDYFGSEVWQRFLYSVEYRNLLVHECTYLGQDRTPYLIAACQIMLERISELAGIAE